MSEREVLDNSCWKLVETILHRPDERWWFGKLKKESGMNDKPYRTHFTHLKERGVIEYLGPRQKGKVRRFELRLDPHLFMIWWPPRVVALAREVLRIHGGIDASLVVSDLSDIKKVRGGVFLIEHGRKGTEHNLQQPSNLLLIQWRHVKRNKTMLRTEFIPGSSLPTIEQLIEFLGSRGGKLGD